MVADPLLLKAGSWLAIAEVLVLTVLAFVMGWGVLSLGGGKQLHAAAGRRLRRLRHQLQPAKQH